MTLPRFIQNHNLSSYPAALINRDDSGMAKRLPFGGSTRSRISSQSLKRHWRNAGEASHEAAARVPFSLQGLGLPLGERRKEIVLGAILPQALSGQAPAHPQVQAALVDALLGTADGHLAAPRERGWTLVRAGPLGGGFDLPQIEWPALGARIDELLRGQSSLLDATLSDAGQALAQRYTAQLIAWQPSAASTTATAATGRTG